MLSENNNYIIDNKNDKPLEVVSIPVSLFESMQGKYFVGQNEYLTVQIWVNTNQPSKWNISSKISPTNTSLDSPPKNKVDIKFVQSTIEVPQSGVNVYDRIIPPYTTLVDEEDGKFIEAPGGNYVLIIKSSSSQTSMVVAAFGWFEKSR